MGLAGPYRKGGGGSYRTVRQVQVEHARLTREKNEAASSEATTATVYKMEFGKARGKTLAQVTQDLGEVKAKQYFQTLVAMGFHAKFPSFAGALQQAGFLDELVAAAPVVQQERAKRDVARYEQSLVESNEVHPEWRKLLKLKGEEGAAHLEELGAIVPASVRDLVRLKGEEPGTIVPVVIGAFAKRVAKRRKTPSRAQDHVKSCMHCGAIGHNAHTCPQKHPLPTLRAVSLVRTSQAKNKQIAALVARIESTPHLQRSAEYDNRPVRRSRAKERRSFLDFARARPGEMYEFLVWDGLLCDLTGRPCPRAQCVVEPPRGLCNDLHLPDMPDPKPK